MSEHKAYDELKSKLALIAQSNNQEGIRAVIALAYLDNFESPPQNAPVTKIMTVVHIMEGTVGDK